MAKKNTKKVVKKTIKKTSPQKKILKSLKITSSCEDCENAKIILKKAHEASSAMLHCFDLLRKERGNLRGGTTDNEQAALRSMLIMAAAGLDSMIKQLIRDTLTPLSHKDEKVNGKLSDFLKRKLQEDPKFVAGLLSSVLIAENQRKQVIELYIDDLTGSSLQSTEELFKAAAALGIQTHGIDKAKDKPIFDARNQMIHELDIDLSAARRSQNQRKLPQMISWTNRLFVMAKLFLEAVDKKLKKNSAEIY
ncbi:MAG: hypothetical protein K8S55_14535 [Phycisphaerae bacterium]|nr:hypothetical protein [Phycisphaerae bacterium]